MSYLIPMNLQLNAEVGDKKGGKREYCPQLPGEMASLQHEWASVSWGAGVPPPPRHLALCPAVLDPTTKAGLTLTGCFLGEQEGALPPAERTLSGRGA